MKSISLVAEKSGALPSSGGPPALPTGPSARSLDS